MNDIRVVIAIPSTQEWSADFGMSLIFMTNYLAANGKIGDKYLQFRVHNKKGSILASMRESLLRDAIDGDATHLLFIDSDQTFPRDLFHRLYAQKKEVVACNIATKMLPSTSTARMKDPKSTAGIPLITKPDSTLCTRVWRVGTGIMLIDLSIFKKHKIPQPWFNQHWNEELQSYTGEDWAFCENLEKAGVGIYVDQSVSREIGHVGSLVYNHTLVEVSEELENEPAHSIAS